MQSKKLIKVINPNNAEQLAVLGFSYITEQINNQKIFVFEESVDIIKHLQSNFNKNDFVMEDRLRF